MPIIRKRRLLIDTDTASDDAVALIMALRSPEIEVLGITVPQRSPAAIAFAKQSGSPGPLSNMRPIG